MRPEWHYEYRDKEGILVRFICNDQLKYRLKFHGRIFYNRKDAIQTLMSIEEQKERQYLRNRKFK